MRRMNQRHFCNNEFFISAVEGMLLAEQVKVI